MLFVGVGRGGGGGCIILSNIAACGPPASFSVHLVVVVDLSLLRIVVEGSDNQITLEQPVQYVLGI